MNEVNNHLITILNNTPAMVVHLDTKFNFLFVNKAYADSTNFPIDFFLGKNHFELYPNPDTQAIFQEVVDTGKPFFTYARPFEYPNQPEKGTTYWNWSLVPVKKGEEKLVSSLIFTLEDITEKIRAEKIIEQARELEEENTRKLKEAHFEVIQRQFAIDQHAIVGITDLDGNIIYANSKFCDISKYSKEELIGSNHRIVNSGYHDKEFFRKMYETIQSGKTWYGEIRNKTKDGNFYWVASTIVPLKNNEGQIIQYISIRTDITKRVKAEEESRINESKFRTIFDQAPLGIGLLESRTGNFIQINPKYSEIIGYTQTEIETLNFQYITYPDDLQDDLKNMEKLISGEINFFNMEKRLIRKDKSIIWVNLTCVPLRMEGEELKYHIAILSDITDAKKASEQLKDYTQNLKMLNATKDKFFSIIAHDLRNPFYGILGLLDIILGHTQQKSFTTGDQTLRYLQLVRESSKSTFDLLENLLQWVRTQTGNIGYNPRPIHFNTLLSYTLPTLSGNALKKNIIIETHLSENDLVFVDEALINSVLRNLLSNAIKFTYPNGKVVITSTPVNSALQISITDTGRGISADNINKLFKIESKFSQVGTENESGTGLGLILCKEFVEKNQGIIWVNSDIDKGSTFTFTLPLAKSDLL